MEIKNIYPTYPSTRERQEEAYRRCLEALAALQAGKMEGDT
jgi:hypothetical protein